MADMTIKLKFEDEASNAIRKIIREELDDTHLALECSSVNCDREARLENKVQGKLDLSPRQDGTGPSIWVDAYLCDVCMSRVGKGRQPSMAENHKAYHPEKHSLDDYFRKMGKYF